MTTKRMLKKQIDNILNGSDPDGIIEIFYINPITGEKIHIAVLP